MIAFHSRVFLVLLLILGLLYYRDTLWRSTYSRISPDGASGGYGHTGHDDIKAELGGWGRKEGDVIRRRVVAVADLHGDLEVSMPIDSLSPIDELTAKALSPARAQCSTNGQAD